jgi:tRNA A37 N6-isopentenylltransferase MiaA
LGGFASLLWLFATKTFTHAVTESLTQVDAETGGLLEEASWLLDMGVLPNTNSASRGIGYQEVWSLSSLPSRVSSANSSPLHIVAIRLIDQCFVEILPMQCHVSRK